MVNDDFSIFSRDPVLTSLRDLTVANLCAELGQCVPGTVLDAPPHRYRITNMRYSPAQKLVIGLNTSDGASPIAIRIFPRKSLRNRLTKARRVHPDHTFLLDGASAVAWVFPAERKLKLDLLADRSRLAAILQAHRGFRLTKLELVHFVPEHTFTACAYGRRNDGSDVCEYLKIYYNDDGANTSKMMQQLVAQLDGTSISIPDDVSYLPHERLLIQSSLVRDATARLSDATVAGALAQLHGLQASAPPIGGDDSATHYESILKLVANTFPSLLTSMCRIAGDVRKALQKTPATGAVLLHGDAHLGNLFPLVNGRIGVIDLDRMCWGPPEEDLASYFAFKLWLQLRRRQSADALLQQFPHFLRTYNREAPSPVSTQRAYIVLAHKMITERIRRGIVRGKLSSASELVEFARLACRCLQAAGQDHA